MAITVAQLAAIAPRCADPTAWAEVLSSSAERFEINTPARAAAFLGQVAFESVGLTCFEEGLRYSASRLVQVWPREFPTLEAATPYAGDPRALANRVYAGRDGNGDEASGDGWRFHGRGPIQLTGRANYAALAAAIGDPLILASPEMLITPLYGALGAAWYWSVRGLNALADAGNFSGITRRINGSLDGEADREVYWRRAQRALTPVVA